MVEFTIIDFNIDSSVRVKGIEVNTSKVSRTTKNLCKMVAEGRNCKVVSPKRPLNDAEVEQYRKFFCKKAKADGVNYIYYPVPVEVTNNG